MEDEERVARKIAKKLNDDKEAIRKRRHVIKEVFGFIIVFIIILIIFLSAFYSIPAGYRGVLLTFGKPSMTAQGEGIHVKIPFVQSVQKMDVRTQKYEAELTAASSDLQDVTTKIAINYHIVPEQAPEIYQKIGTAYAEKVIYPLEQETNKAITAQFSAEELITKRESVRSKMKEALIEKLASRGIIVEEISIVDFKFSESFSQAIEAKVTALQLKLKAENDLQRIQVEAQQAVAVAQGQSQAIEIINKQLSQSPEYLQWMAIQKWNGQLPAVIGGANPFFDITSYVSQK